MASPHMGDAETSRILDFFQSDLTGKRIWHYTREQSARQIVTTGVLRLSSARFMNDPGEGKLAWRHIRQAAQEYATSERLLKERAHEVAFRLLFDPSGHDFEVFLASFGVQEDPASDEDDEQGPEARDGHDSLSQWAMYGDDGNGVALVFDIVRHPSTPIFEVDQGRVYEGAPLPYTCHAEFCRVRYDPLELNDIHGAALDFLRRAAPTSVEMVELACDTFNSVARAMIKSDFYSQEHECRLVARVRSDLAGQGHLAKTKPIKFHEDGRPYLNYQWADSLRLVGYWLGPKRSRDDAAASRLYLGQLGFHDVDVRNSRGTYRGAGE